MNKVKTIKKINAHKRRKEEIMNHTINARAMK